MNLPNLLLPNLLDFISKCLFLYKVDSLRAWFNLKYVYVLKSLTMTSKKIDCLS